MTQKQSKRNKYAFDPIMAKGGVHEKTNKAKRRNEKMKWRKAAHTSEPFFCIFYALTHQLSRPSSAFNSNEIIRE
jgi:hypothetical protein